tara:strand:+ start:1722 stop:3311 length:1590 start_codon:yes stop_codon:yes gene_type:complete
MQFSQPELSTIIGGQDVELESVQVLVYAERYPVLNVAMLIEGLKRQREVMVQDAKAEADAASVRAYLAMLELIVGADSWVPPPPSDDPNAPVATVRRRTPDEDAIHRVPKELLLQWQNQGLAADTILQSAHQLTNAVQVVSNTLGLPAFIVDPSQPPLPLPSVGDSIWYESVIAAVSQPLLQEEVYERPLEVNAFLGRAAVSREVLVEQFDAILSVVEPPPTPPSVVYTPPVPPDEILQVVVPLGTPAPGDLRTRYFFAVRSKSTQEVPGQVTTVVSMAPVPVPVAPTSLNVTIGSSGVGLTWDPSVADLLLRRLDSKTLAYNVYRLLPEGVTGPGPLNPAPLLQPTYTDGTAQSGETYLYEVRAIIQESTLPPLLSPRRESRGVKSDPVKVDDRYRPAPPTSVNLTRADNVVTLQWTPSTSIDIVGYRVYRHPYPAPATPARVELPLDDTSPGDTSADPASVAQEIKEFNEMVRAGWELITDELVPFSRTFDGDADPAVRYVYAVEAIDAAGNLSTLAIGSEEEDSDL